MSAIKIRAVRSQADVDCCKTLQKVCLPWDDALTPTKTGWWLLARAAGGTAIAYSGSYEWKAENEHAIVIAHQGVIEAYRGLHLQARLIRQTCLRARDKGVPEVWSYVAAHNLASANSFIAEGFRLWRPHMWNGSVVHETEKEWFYFRKTVIK